MKKIKKITDFFAAALEKGGAGGNGGVGKDGIGNKNIGNNDDKNL